MTTPDFRAGQILTAADLNQIVLQLNPLLFSTELDSNQGGVTINDIPQDWSNLKLVIDGQITGTAVRNIALEINGDTSGTAAWMYTGRQSDGTFMEGSSANATLLTVGRMGINWRSNIVAHITNYSSSVAKGVQGTWFALNGSDPTTNVWARGLAGGIRTVSEPITDLRVTPGAGESFVAGTTVYLYGEP